MTDAGFWTRKWEQNDIAFHESEANPLLVQYFAELSVPAGGRVFLPLCGKTSAIHWLRSRGYRVAGAELSKVAIEQLFAELRIEPQVSRAGEALDHYHAQDIDIFVGDLFDLSRDILGLVDAIYDRAALVAPPAEMRSRYAAHLVKITDGAPQLLISYEYDQSAMAGPPFSIRGEELGAYYRDSYDLRLLARTDVPGGLKGKCAARETVWLLKNA